MYSLREILKDIEGKDTGKYVKHEWQLFAYKIAKVLDDLDRVPMYMSIAKTESRDLLQHALDFVKESKARSKPRLFLWKVKQLRIEREKKEKTTS